MTRISSLFVASTLAILPISAFAQQTAAPVKNAAPTSMMTTPNTTAPAVGASVTDKTDAATTAHMTQPAKPAVKSPAVDTKAQVHGMNNVKMHHAKASIPAKAS